MVKFLLSFLLLLFGIDSFAQVSFDDAAMKKVLDYAVNKQHEKADSILDYYLSRPHTNDEDFLISYAKVYNGYIKIDTYQDFSVIVPYAAFGKKVFNYKKKHH